MARNLAAARTAFGLSQAKLAEDAGVSRATLNQLEGGTSAKGDPPLSTIASLASALGIPPMLLLLDQDDLAAITGASEAPEARSVQDELSTSDRETMSRLLQSGVARNRAEAVHMGTAAARTAGVSGAAVVGAAIGTALVPGVGTAVGAAIAAVWLARRHQ